MRSREFDGDHCRELREDRKLTLKELAAQVSKQFGIPTTESTVSKWECGDRSPSPKRFGALCQALGVAEDELLRDREEGAA